MSSSFSWDHASDFYQRSRDVTIPSTKIDEGWEQQIASYREQIEVLEAALNVPDHNVNIYEIVEEILETRGKIDQTLPTYPEEGQKRALQYCDERLRKIIAEIESEKRIFRQDRGLRSSNIPPGYWWLHPSHRNFTSRLISGII